MTLQWVSADLRTGRVINDLPGIVCDWPLRRTIGQYDTATAHLNLDQAPADWPDAVLEGATVLHVYDDQDPARTLQWSGIVVVQTRNTDTDTVDLTLATGEAYLDRRYVGDVSYPATGQNDIVTGLVNAYILDGVKPGLPITVTVVNGGAGTLRDRFYNDVDNATVYSRLQQLMAVDGGPEWTLQWAWTADGQSIKPGLLVGNRLGTAPNAGLDPSTTWAMPGCVATAKLVRDYTAGKGANTVTAYSSGQGAATPTSGPQAAADFQTRPTYEHRWTPSTSITDPLVLAQWAQRALTVLAPGSIGLTLTAALNGPGARAPRLGVDWQLGDTIGYQIGGLDTAGRDIVKAFPGGLAGTGRVIAYELSDTTITPVLAQSTIYTEPS